MFFQHGIQLIFFNSVYIDKRTETIASGEDLDLDPYVLRDQIISGKMLSKKGKGNFLFALELRDRIEITFTILEMNRFFTREL